VQVIRRGKVFADYFSDAVWGGRAKALVAAQRFRDELLLRIEPDTRVRRRAPKGIRCTTGAVGVSFERYVVDGRVYQRYVGAGRILKKARRGAGSWLSDTARRERWPSRWRPGRREWLRADVAGSCCNARPLESDWSRQPPCLAR
jgi:hypothetical protein